MRRLAVAAVALVLAASCTPDKPADTAPAVTAQVRVPGAATAITHGNDPLPPRPAGLIAQTPPEAPWPCVGSGTDGRRVQLLYVHGGTYNFAAMRSTFEAWARQIEGMFLTSARETGGERLLKFVTEGDCSLSIREVAVPAGTLASFDATINELVRQGFSDPNRIYHAWTESNAYCGIGTVYSDDSPSGNINDRSAQFSRSDRPCWNANTAAHEIVHNLGGVQNSAPNSTGGLHCRDEADVMCYPDGAPNGTMIQRCPAVGEDRLDCEKNDYFSTAPSGYLATHWNVANASALVSEASSTTSTVTPPPTTSTTLPPTTSTTVGKGKTVTQLNLPSRATRGDAFAVPVYVQGDCRPTGSVAIYVSGKLISRQLLTPWNDNTGQAQATITISGSVQRPTIRADYSGDDHCATSRDSVRQRMVG